MTGQPLLLLVPIEPCETGNGLAMRVARWARAAQSMSDPRVGVVPVAGRLSACPRPVAVPVFGVAPTDRRRLAALTVELVGDPDWRDLLGRAEPMPQAARIASPALARDVISGGAVDAGTPVVAIRSYLAPLALAVAQRLGSSWTALDLDDDDETLARSMGRTDEADAFGRLVSIFAPRFDSVCLASRVEASLLGDRMGMAMAAVPNGVEVPPAVPARAAEPATLLFVGNMGYPPNAEAARILVTEVLPIVQRAIGSSAKVMLVGDLGTGAATAELARAPRVTATGFVDDLDAYYRRASVVVAPIRVGGGTRIKLLEAFANGVPVVTTPAGSAGIDARDGVELLLGTTPAGLAECVIRVLTSPALARSLSDAAFTFVGAHHSGPVVEEVALSFLRSAERTVR